MARSLSSRRPGPRPLLAAAGIAATALVATQVVAGPTQAAEPGRAAGSAPQAAAPGWQLRWSPQPGKDGLKAFEHLEDDRKKSHPGTKHISVQGDTYRFEMHTRDRDGSDRQRNESAGMSAGGKDVVIRKGETWRLTHSLFIPSSLRATSSFTHIMQLKMPGLGSAPIMVMSLRRDGSQNFLEVKVAHTNQMVGRTNLAPLVGKWLDTELEFTASDRGNIRWVLKDGGRTVIDASKSGQDLFMSDRVRPKWGIYRSLGDKGNLRDTHLLMRNMRAYQRTG